MATVDVTRIASNIGALNSLNSLMNINAKLATHQTRLSTGKRINSAADDPAGLTIATKMLARSEGLKVTLDNIGDAKNMLSVAEGGLSKMTDIITQMRNKAEQAASDTLGSSERATIQTQLSSYAAQLQDIIDQTKWNGVKLLDQTSGPKQFQTGVDEGENTTWTLPKALDPATLDLSKVVGSSQATTSVRNASFTVDALPSGTLNNMSEMSTGDYSFEILAKSTSAAVASASLDTTSKLVNGVSGMEGSATSASGNELVSGHYKMTIDKVTDATHVDYTITNLDDATWGTNGSVAVTGADLTPTLGKIDLADTGGTLGLTLTLTGTPTDLVANQSMNFEFIKGGDVKLELNDSSGQASQVARANANTDTLHAGYYSATSAYVAVGAAAAAYQSGRGVSATVNTWANSVVGQKNVFTYEQASNFSVDVSSAAKAGKYMTVANNSLDTVTSALSDLGALMARLTFKEDSIATAQVNVEAAHSRIMNANMAEEQMNASKYTILQQTAIAMLAQANQAPQNLLSLFR